MSLPKYLTEGNTIKKDSIKHEKKVCRQLSSGAMWFAKGDLKSEDCLFELKKGKKQVSITGEMMEKIFKEATSIGKMPILLVEINGYQLIGEIIKL